MWACACCCGSSWNCSGAPTLGSTLAQHLAQHLVHTCSHCPHLVQHLPHLHGASQCRVWIYMKLATAASLLSFFSPITLFLILIFRLFIFHIFNKVDCRSTWKSLANMAAPISSLPFQLITFSTLLSEIKGHQLAQILTNWPLFLKLWPLWSHLHIFNLLIFWSVYSGREHHPISKDSHKLTFVQNTTRSAESAYLQCVHLFWHQRVHQRVHWLLQISSQIENLHKMNVWTDLWWQL